MNELGKSAILLCAFSGIVGLNLLRYDEPIEITPLMSAPNDIRRSVADLQNGTADGFQQITDATFVQTFSRPLFNENRRKFVKAAKPEPVKQVKITNTGPVASPDIRILGISFTTGDRAALIKLPDEPNAIWYRLGETIGAWKLVSIENDRIGIQNGDSTASVEMYEQIQ